jgi:catechol 2,3-dioxygenase-like lactoylglutathione lyase family enzyme
MQTVRQVAEWAGPFRLETHGYEPAHIFAPYSATKPCRNADTFWRNVALLRAGIQGHDSPMSKPLRLRDQPLIAFVATRDPDRAKKFYSGTLGLPLVSEELPFALVFDAHGTMLRVTVVKKLKPAGYTVLGWQVPNIAAAANGLTKAGVRFERYPGMQQDALGIWTSPGGGKVAWFMDPDGNTLSISQHRSVAV